MFILVLIKWKYIKTLYIIYIATFREDKAEFEAFSYPYFSEKLM